MALSEAQILHDIRLALGREPDLVLWRLGQGAQREQVEAAALRRILASDLSPVAKLAAIGALLDAPGRFWRAGLVPGAADLIGLLGPGGRWLALEIKAPRGRPSPEQARWLALVRSRGGFAAVVRSVQEAREALARARAGACE